MLSGKVALVTGASRGIGAAQRAFHRRERHLAVSHCHVRVTDIEQRTRANTGK
jgi:NAD(P)-dependent dehydrogenase (short-subunit alcohol dehydrogenase family)